MITQYGSRQKVNQEPALKLMAMPTLPSIQSSAKVLKIVMFPYGKEVSLSRQTVGARLTFLRA